MMAGSPQLPLTDSLRSDILLLSSYLSGQKNSLIKSSSVDDNLALSVDISTLLSIGDRNRGQQALNVNTIMKKHTSITMEFLVCAENGRHGDLSAKARSDCSQTLHRVEGKRMGDATQDDPVLESRFWGHSSGRLGAAQNVTGRSAKEVGDLVCITPVMECGRKLLDKWDPQVRDNKRVEIDM